MSLLGLFESSSWLHMASQRPFRTGHNGCSTSRRSGADGRPNKFQNNKKYKLREKVRVVSCKNNLNSCLLNVDGLSDASFAG